MRQLEELENVMRSLGNFVRPARSIALGIIVLTAVHKTARAKMDLKISNRPSHTADRRA